MAQTKSTTSQYCQKGVEPKVNNRNQKSISPIRILICHSYLNTHSFNLYINYYEIKYNQNSMQES